MAVRYRTRAAVAADIIDRGVAYAESGDINAAISDFARAAALSDDRHTSLMAHRNLCVTAPKSDTARPEFFLTS